MIKRIYFRVTIFLALLLITGWVILFHDQASAQLAYYGNFALKTYAKAGLVYQEIFKSNILQYNGPADDVDLTTEGVWTETNNYRRTDTLPPLTYSKKLEAAAKIKLDDMFNNNYFSHISVTGKGPSDLADRVNYSYITVGENLAMGNFGGDPQLVKAWMDSPGHRANILNKNYTEIGIAVGKGMYDGESKWLAVQEFGTPADVCEQVDTKLELMIESSKLQMKMYDSDIKEKKALVDQYRDKDSIKYNESVNAYNTLIEQYNILSKKTKEMVLDYNEEVKLYNTCIEAYQL
jgi:uncharacterized protein YkwD